MLSKGCRQSCRMVISQVEREKYISDSPSVASSGDVEVNLDT